jgi:hypothetical protein
VYVGALKRWLCGDDCTTRTYDNKIYFDIEENETNKQHLHIKISDETETLCTIYTLATLLEIKSFHLSRLTAISLAYGRGISIISSTIDLVTTGRINAQLSASPGGSRSRCPNQRGLLHRNSLYRESFEPRGGAILECSKSANSCRTKLQRTCHVSAPYSNTEDTYARNSRSRNDTAKRLLSKNRCRPLL